MNTAIVIYAHNFRVSRFLLLRLTFELTGEQKRSFCESSERSERG